MLRENNIPVKNSFNIWFNREKRKEFYTTSIILYKTAFNHNPNNKFSDIILKTNKATNEIYFTSANFNAPFEESYGTLLIKFLNANFSSFETAYDTFFCFYGFSILEEFYKNIPKAQLFKSEEDFFNTYEPIFINIKRKLKELQYLMKRCIDYMYNLNNNLEDKNYSSFEKYLTYVIKNNLFRYSINIDVFYFQQFAHDTLNIAVESITPKIVREHLENGIIDVNDSPVFHACNLSNILYVSLSEIASNKDIKIKTCKNCGKYFIPIKNTEKYCDIAYYENERTCKMVGATNSYTKKRKSVEGIKFYRNNYQRRLMQAKRSDNEQVKLAFENWKQLAKAKIKEFNNNEISAEELLEWMIQNKNI
ncbi:MAG: DUF6076 domain-containing protein [Clostridia bacterium]